MEKERRKKWENTEEQEENRKKPKRKKKEHFPLRCVKRAKDVNRFQAHEWVWKGSAKISTAV